MTDDLSLPFVERELRDSSDGHKAIVIRRRFNVSVERIWSALTDPQQIMLWYLPIEGDLREGGYYILVGNAVGEIRRCAPPHAISVSWVYGDFQSEIGIRLTSPTASQTLLEFVQAPVPVDMIANPSPDLWGLAVNWEMVLVGLEDYLAGNTPEGRAIDWLRTMSVEWRADNMARANLHNQAWQALIEADG